MSHATSTTVEFSTFVVRPGAAIDNRRYLNVQPDSLEPLYDAVETDMVERIEGPYGLIAWCDEDAMSKGSEVNFLASMIVSAYHGKPITLLGNIAFAGEGPDGEIISPTPEQEAAFYDLALGIALFVG